MKSLVRLTDEEAITQLGLSEKVAEELKGKKYWNEGIAMTSLMLKGEIPIEQYSKWFNLTSLPPEYFIGKNLFQYRWTKKETDWKVIKSKLQSIVSNPN
ncbi:Uncharacterised protein [uncultured archaeon]|nr:Uncharacterised protein [uncultured archaeon]